jgi:hypothetical protein
MTDITGTQHRMVTNKYCAEHKTKKLKGKNGTHVRGKRNMTLGIILRVGSGSKNERRFLHRGQSNFSYDIVGVFFAAPMLWLIVLN